MSQSHENHYGNSISKTQTPISNLPDVLTKHVMDYMDTPSITTASSLSRDKAIREIKLRHAMDTYHSKGLPEPAGENIPVHHNQHMRNAAISMLKDYQYTDNSPERQSINRDMKRLYTYNQSLKSQQNAVKVAKKQLKRHRENNPSPSGVSRLLAKNLVHQREKVQATKERIATSKQQITNHL